MGWVKNRLKERSTWLGFVTLASIAGYSVTDVQRDMIITVGTTLAALIMTFTADKKPEPDWRAPDATQQQIISTPDINSTTGIKG